MSKKITFLHPDFGIGGAERLALDAALAMRGRGHSVRIVTNHFTEDRCFTELKSFKEDITVIDYFPRKIYGKCYALCAYIRMCIAAIFICLKHRDADIVFCDLVSAPLFILRWFSNARLFFYCHYPDQLLTERETAWKLAYRTWIVDPFERWTTGLADVIFVNSKYTEGVFRETFPSLAHKPLIVLHPSLNTRFFDEEVERQKREPNLQFSVGRKKNIFEDAPNQHHLFLSINRFEAKKNVELALDAFAQLHGHLTSAEFDNCEMVLAGGCDTRNAENLKYYQKLQKLVEERGLAKSVSFHLNPSDSEKVALIRSACLMVYTPENEHFGIVPLEAMYLGRPVLAVNSGGPRETVIDNVTGWLRASDPNEFAEVLATAVRDTGRVSEMGEVAREHVRTNFAFDRFAKQLDREVSRGEGASDAE